MSLGRLAHRSSERGEFARQTADQPGEQVRYCLEAGARLTQRVIKINGAADLDLQAMYPPCGRRVAIEHVTAGVGPIVRRAAAGRGEVIEGGGA